MNNLYENSLGIYPLLARISLRSRLNIRIPMHTPIRLRNVGNCVTSPVDFVAKSLNVSTDDLILDAGCGMGTTSRYLRKNFGCSTIGITKNLDEQLLANSPTDPVALMDYAELAFRKETFTVVLFYESLCLRTCGFEKVLAEAFSTLTSNGTIAIVDVFYEKDNSVSRKHQRLFNIAADHYSTELETYLNKFGAIWKCVNITDDALRSVTKFAFIGNFLKLLKVLLPTSLYLAVAGVAIERELYLSGSATYKMYFLKKGPPPKI